MRSVLPVVSAAIRRPCRDAAPDPLAQILGTGVDHLVGAVLGSDLQPPAAVPGQQHPRPAMAQHLRRPLPYQTVTDDQRHVTGGDRRTGTPPL